MMGQLLDLSDFSNCRRDISELWMRLQTNVSHSGTIRQGTIELTLWVQFQSISHIPRVMIFSTVWRHFSPRDSKKLTKSEIIHMFAGNNWTHIVSTVPVQSSLVQSSTGLSPVAISSGNQNGRRVQLELSVRRVSGSLKCRGALNNRTHRGFQVCFSWIRPALRPVGRRVPCWRGFERLDSSYHVGPRSRCGQRLQSSHRKLLLIQRAGLLRSNTSAHW